jgi:hypothetical protein
MILGTGEGDAWRRRDDLAKTVLTRGLRIIILPRNPNTTYPPYP